MNSLSSIVESISQRILGSPLAAKVDAELTEERLATQRALVEQLTALDAHALDAALTAARDRAARRLDGDRRQAALDQWRAEDAAWEQAVTLATLARDHQRSLTQKALLDLASPRIAACVAALQALWEETSRQGQASRDTNQLTDAVVIWSNAASLSARLAAIRHAIVEANDLVFVPLTEADLGERLREITAAIPPLDTFLRPNTERSLRERLFGNEAA